MADAVYAIQALSATPFLLGDNPGQREAWLPRLIDGKAMGAFAMSEAEAGSEAHPVEQQPSLRRGRVSCLNARLQVVLR